MGRSSFLKLILLSMVLILSFSRGFGTKIMGTVDQFEESTAQLQEEFAGTSREMIEVMDYKDPGPNTNPKTGYILGPPPQG
ncbi:hypothetical protein DITRI_Ditri16bG0112700 [Diplodiscus trichospermus]